MPKSAAERMQEGRSRGRRSAAALIALLLTTRQVENERGLIEALVRSRLSVADLHELSRIIEEEK